MPPGLFNVWAGGYTAEIAQFRQPTEERVSAFSCTSTGPLQEMHV